jgi:hypothetical protein
MGREGLAVVEQMWRPKSVNASDLSATCTFRHPSSLLGVWWFVRSEVKPVTHSERVLAGQGCQDGKRVGAVVVVLERNPSAVLQ